MENQLFRQKSIDRISSPEDLHDYMRVTSPRLWMILGAIIILLAGFVVYASTATMVSTVSIRVNTDQQGKKAVTGRDMFYYSYLPSAMKDKVSAGMVVQIGEERGKVSYLTITEDDSLELIITMDNPQYDLPDGEYDAKLVLESTTPISFLWN